MYSHVLRLVFALISKFFDAIPFYLYMGNKRPNPGTRWASESTTERGSVGAISVKTFAEPHYTVDEVAQLWKLSTDFVRRLFRDEPGVLVISPRQRKGKRAYVTLRIPQSVLERVHRRLSLVKVLTR
jgi:hypothetical protein